MQRNFRTAYLQTLGFHGVQDGVQVKLSLQTVLSDPVIDLEKLSKLCTNYGLPAQYRVISWKLLLGVLPRHRDNWDFVQQQRDEQFQTVYRFICSLSGLHPGLSSEITAAMLVKMCLTTTRMDIRIVDRCEQDKACAHMLSIARVFLEACELESDAYWLCLRFLTVNKLALPVRTSMDTPGLVRLGQRLMRLLLTEHPQLHRHLSAALDVGPFVMHWFRSCFAASFGISSTQKLWERTIGSGSLVPVCIALSILITFSHILLRCTDAAQLEDFLASKLPEGHTDRIVDGGVQLFEKYGGVGND